LGGANGLLSGWVCSRASKERKKKGNKNLSLPILVMEGGNLKKGHTTQNISAKLCGLRSYVDCCFAFEFGYKRKTRSAKCILLRSQVRQHSLDFWDEWPQNRETPMMDPEHATF
jgi:hypothetical protein